jgi:hypothetical protein
MLETGSFLRQVNRFLVYLLKTHGVVTAKG